MYFFRHGCSVEFSNTSAVTRKVEPTLWYVFVLVIVSWTLLTDEVNTVAKSLFHNTQHKSRVTVFHLRLHSYFLAWKCDAFKRVGLVVLQLELKSVFYLVIPRMVVGPTQPPIQWVKQPGRETDHSLPTSAKFKSAWSYTFTPQYILMVWCLVKHRNNLTFTF
jgi:hypothetical protein